ncbi:ABC transporter substrate-binding protein [Massilia sp. H-1]|nr:ABC transporter substrate-binding protein [Massilia sp. H-1]
MLRACALGAVCALALPGHAAAREAVTLQLTARHQFQFAGYYAAQQQGYYRDASSM